MAKKEKKAKKKYTAIGGQALMEGIMMRGPEKAVMCVRRMDGSITSETVVLKKPTVWNKIPIIRGVVSFVQSMAMGTKMLMRSADLVIEDEENAAKAEQAALEAAEAGEAAAAAESSEDALPGEAAAENPENPCEEPTDAIVPDEKIAANDGEVKKTEENKGNEKPAEKVKNKKDKKKESDSDMGFFTFIATVLGFGLAILLFFFLPTWAYNGLLMILPENVAEYLTASTVWKSVIEGIIKMIIFFGYMIAISNMKEIKRLFQYHGAEHKTIFCYEAGEELTVENVRKYKRFHPRCGTSFIILMLLVGIAAGICITAFLPQYDSVWIRPLIKLALIPLTMGVGYELLKLAGKHDNIITRIISAPGLWMQRISTKEPDDSQIECAIAALKPVIPEDGTDMQ